MKAIYVGDNLYFYLVSLLRDNKVTGQGEGAVNVGDYIYHAAVCANPLSMVANKERKFLVTRIEYEEGIYGEDIYYCENSQQFDSLSAVKAD